MFPVVQLVVRVAVLRGWGDLRCCKAGSRVARSPRRDAGFRFSGRRWQVKCGGRLRGST